MGFSFRTAVKQQFAVMVGLAMVLGGCAASIDDDQVAKNDKVKTNKPAANLETNKVDEGSANKEIEEKNGLYGDQQENKTAEGAERESTQKQKEELIQKFGLEAVVVASVTDGDTIVLADGRKVRLIGVNTPESTTRIEEYGKEASAYTKSRLNGKQIWVQKDVSETDRYKRSLRIVWLDIPTNDLNEDEIRKKMFNAQLVLDGYAEPSTYPPDVKYSDYFVKFAKEARSQNKGLWAFGETGTTKGDLDPKNSQNSKPKSAANTPASPPNSESEDFKNCTELRKVYPNGVPSDHPAYAPRHDRDKDNWACER